MAKLATGSGGLINWAARSAAQWAAANRELYDQLGEDAWVAQATKASERIRDEGAARGTRLHTMAEALLYGDALPELDADGVPIPDEERRSAQQMARFMDAHRLEPVCHEAIVFHEEHRWAGRLDAIADLADGRRWLLDWKTGASGIWPDTALQLAAYRHASHICVRDRDLLMTPVSEAAAVWIRPDSWQLIPVLTDADAYAAFRSALGAYTWANRHRRDAVGAPLPVPA